MPHGQDSWIYSSFDATVNRLRQHLKLTIRNGLKAVLDVLTSYVVANDVENLNPQSGGFGPSSLGHVWAHRPVFMVSGSNGDPMPFRQHGSKRGDP